jgi:predicted flap endonuclease-1-like 5' DNA nuclease
LSWKEDKWWQYEEPEEAEPVDENDLTLLPGVDEELAEKLKEHGYTTLYEVAFEHENILVKAVRITTFQARRIIYAANRLLGFEEEDKEEEE